MSRLPNQFHRGNEIVSIPLTNSVSWLKGQIEYVTRSLAKAEHPDAQIEYAEYAVALEGALQLKLNNLCPVCNGRGFLS